MQPKNIDLFAKIFAAKNRWSFIAEREMTPLDEVMIHLSLVMELGWRYIALKPLNR